MTRRVAASILVALATATTAGAQSSPGADPVVWTSYGADDQLTNAIQTRVLTLRAVPRLRLSWSVELEGAI